MTAVLWDQLEDRIYETGLDRGVLYHQWGGGVPWNGLTSVEELLSDEVSTPIYFDGVKRQDIESMGDYTATLNAFTYPRELSEYGYDGMGYLGEGFLASFQPVYRFGLSYRTLIGNAVEGTDYGYKIHLLYNLMASASAKPHNTWDDAQELDEFSWTITGLPIDIPDFRPTAHLIFDSTELEPAWLTRLEDVLYGDETNEPHLPSWTELIGLFDVITEPITEPL